MNPSSGREAGRNLKGTDGNRNEGVTCSHQHIALCVDWRATYRSVICRKTYRGTCRPTSDMQTIDQHIDVWNEEQRIGAHAMEHKGLNVEQHMGNKESNTYTHLSHAGQHICSGSYCAIKILSLGQHLGLHTHGSMYTYSYGGLTMWSMNKYYIYVQDNYKWGKNGTNFSQKGSFSEKEEKLWCGMGGDWVRFQRQLESCGSFGILGILFQALSR